jgi:hypothetical protein
MTGSNSSTWNIDPTLPVDQPDNRDLALFLQAFARTAVMPLAGDYNRDGSVDAADYVSWRETLGSFVTNFAGADGSGNGIVDDADLSVWRSNFAASTADIPAGPLTVPEPASLWLALLSFFAVISAYSPTRHKCDSVRQ